METNFTIVCRTNLIEEYEYEVYSYRTVVALVSLYVSETIVVPTIRDNYS